MSLFKYAPAERVLAGTDLGAQLLPVPTGLTETRSPTLQQHSFAPCPPHLDCLLFLSCLELLLSSPSNDCASRLVLRQLFAIMSPAINRKACEACTKAKAKCSPFGASVDLCQRCERLNKECVYGQSLRKRGPRAQT